MEGPLFTWSSAALSDLSSLVTSLRVQPARAINLLSALMPRHPEPACVSGDVDARPTGMLGRFPDSGR